MSVSRYSAPSPETSRWRAGPNPITDVLTVLLVVIAAKTAIAEPYYVPSGSMEPTLQIGDELLGDQISLRLQLLLAADVHYASGHAAHFRRVAAPRRCGGLSLARRSFANLGQARRWLPGDRSRCATGSFGSASLRLSRRISRWKLRMAPVKRSRAHRFRAAASTRFSNRTSSIRSTTCPKSSFRRAICSSWATIATTRRTAGSPSARRRGLPARRRSGRRVDALVGSWDLAAKNKPVWEWPSGFRPSRFFTAVR